MEVIGFEKSCNWRMMRRGMRWRKETRKTGKKVGKRQKRYNEEKRKGAHARTVVFRLVDGLQHLASALLCGGSGLGVFIGAAVTLRVASGITSFCKTTLFFF